MATNKRATNQSCPFACLHQSIISRQFLPTSTGGCRGIKVSVPVLSACCDNVLLILVFLLVAHECKYTEDSRRTAIFSIFIAYIFLFRISPRFVYNHRRMKGREILWLVYFGASCCFIAVDCIVCHEVLVIVLPAVSVSEFVNSVINRLA